MIIKPVESGRSYMAKATFLPPFMEALRTAAMSKAAYILGVQMDEVEALLGAGE